MHDEIRKFSLEGQIGEHNIVQTKERLIEVVESMMRDYGYVPSIDNEPQYTHTFNGESFDFSLSVYGVKVGRKEAWTVSGVSAGKTIMKSIPKNKSKPLSVNVE